MKVMKQKITIANYLGQVNSSSLFTAISSLVLQFIENKICDLFTWTKSTYLLTETLCSDSALSCSAQLSSAENSKAEHDNLKLRLEGRIFLQGEWKSSVIFIYRI